MNWTVEQNPIHEGPVEIQVVHVCLLAGGSHSLQLSHVTDANRVAAISAFPYGDGCSPIAFPGDGPVHIIAKPLSKAALSYVIWIPVDGVIATYKLFFHS